jgi:hypothetical protein
MGEIMSLFVTLDLKINSKEALLAALNRDDCRERLQLDRVLDKGNQVYIYLKNFLAPINVTIGGTIRYDEDNIKYTGPEVQSERWGRLEDLGMFYTAELAKEDAESKELSFEEVWDEGNLFVETSHDSFEG